MGKLKLLALTLAAILSASGAENCSLEKNCALTAFQMEPPETEFVMTSMTPKGVAHISKRRDAWIAVIGDLYAGSYHDADDTLYILTTDSGQAWLLTEKQNPWPYEPWSYSGKAKYSYNQLQKSVEQLKTNKETYGIIDCGIDERENTLYVILQYVETENEFNQMKQKIDQFTEIKNIRYTKNGKLHKEIKPGNKAPDMKKILEDLRQELQEKRDMREIETINEYEGSIYVTLKCPSKAFYNFLKNYEYRDFVQIRVYSGLPPANA